MSRVVAWAALRSGHPAPLQLVDQLAAERDLDARDTALARRLVGHEIRRRGTLRAIAQHFSHRRLKPDLAAHLHVALAQLFFFDRIPDHAAVSEACGAVQQTTNQSKVPLINAILHAVIDARQEGHCGDARRDVVGCSYHFDRDVFRDPKEHPFLWAEDALSIPSALMKRWTKKHGREVAEALATYFLNEPPLVLRVVRGDRPALLAELAELEVEARAGQRATTIVCASEFTSSVMASGAFQEGRLTVQGETATAAAELVEARTGETILDLCAAPGGKTAVLAGTGATVVACDVSVHRLERVVSTCRRLDLLESVSLQESDGTAALGDERFDAALVDAPCSNTGVLGARPGARWRYGPQTKASLAELQGRLLREAAEHVRPHGRLVWSTCSLEPEENGQLVRAFLTEHPTWTLDTEALALPDADTGPWDGGYAARMLRS